MEEQSEAMEMEMEMELQRGRHEWHREHKQEDEAQM